MPADSPAVILFDQSGNAVKVIQDSDGYYRLAVDANITQDPSSTDRDKLVSVNFGKTDIEETTYYVLIDLDDANYKHDILGTDVILAHIGGRATKSSSGAKWLIEAMVVLSIDGTSATLGVLPIPSISLQDTSRFNETQFLNTFPNVINLAVSGGDFDSVTGGFNETSVTAVNTGTTFLNAVSNSVTPEVGDVLLRVTLVSGSGTLDFTYSAQYWVE